MCHKLREKNGEETAVAFFPLAGGFTQVAPIKRNIPALTLRQ